MSANGRQTRTFRGKSLGDLLPRIRRELGPDAVITRQREGLQGGFAGFFQKQFVELEAHAGRAGVDLYDDGGDALPDSSAALEGMASPAIQALVQSAAPFADQLTAAGNALDFEEPESTVHSQQSTVPEPAPVRRFGRTRPPQADAIETTLIDAGLS